METAMFIHLSIEYLALGIQVSANLDTNKKCVAVFLDLAKAFDSVSWPNLLRKLELPIDP